MADNSENSAAISVHEREAERIYYAAISYTYTYKEACVRARWLEFESPVAAEYLRWLLRRQGWPRVG